MIYYLRYGKEIAERLGFPLLASAAAGNKELMDVNNILVPTTQALFAADFIFYFKDGKTEYLKDRYYVNAQYTPEEKLSIALRAVPIGRKS